MLPAPIPAPTTPYPPPQQQQQFHNQQETTVSSDAPSTDDSNTTTASSRTNTDSDESPDTDDSGRTAGTVTSNETPPSVSVRSTTTSKSASIKLTTPSPRDTKESAESAYYQYSPTVVYGAGAVSRLPSELGRLRLVSPLIVSSPSRISLARRIQALIPNLDSRILDSALINVPQHVVDDAVLRITGRDCVISVGGTSAVSLAKAIAVRKDIPHICIPTTYSGSEQPSQDQTRRLERMETRRRRSNSSSKSPGGSTTTSNTPSTSKSSGGSSQSRRSNKLTNSRPSIIIYDEDLTAADTHNLFTVPHDSKTTIKPQSRFPEEEESSQWSYFQLPGF